MEKSTNDLADKVAIVTGSSAGIGASIAVEFARLGVFVTLHGRRVEKLEAVSKKCEEVSGGAKKPLIVLGDIRQGEIREKIINDTVNHFGKLDILVNNAGYFDGQPLSEDFETSRLESLLSVHVTAPFHLTKLSIPHLVKTKGNIINISSIVATRVFWPSGVEYSMAKAALDHLTRFTALELGPKGIRANAISPGTIKTEIMDDESRKEESEEEYEAFAKIMPLKRVGNPQEIASMAAYLASDAASYMTGAIIPVDGGGLLTPPLLPTT